MTNVDSIHIPIFPTESPNYEGDFHAWSTEQGARLRLLRVPGIDSANLAEEIEALARRDRNKLDSRTIVILLHLLKWTYQPSRRTASWELTLLEQRRRLDVIVRNSPSLGPLLPSVIQAQYGRAVREAALETGLASQTFPDECEWNWEDVISSDFLP